MVARMADTPTKLGRGRPTKIGVVLRRDPIICAACQGEGTQADDTACPVCKGSGNTGERTVTIADAIVENIRGGNYIETAARLCDIDKTTLHAWLADGAKLCIAVEAGQRTRSTMTKAEQRLLDFSYSVQRAVAEAESAGQASIAAAGRIRQSVTRTTTTTKMVNGVRVTETTTTVEDRPPDWRAMAWHHERRFFHQGWGNRERVEITGEDGGPVNVDLRVGELADRVRRVRERGPEAIEAAVSEQQEDVDDGLGTGAHDGDGE